MTVSCCNDPHICVTSDKAGQSSGNKANPWQTLHHHIVARLLRALGLSK